MQKRTALAATALLLGAQFALVQNSRGHDDVQPQAAHPEGPSVPSGEARSENPYRPESGGRWSATVIGRGGVAPLRDGEAADTIGHLNRGGSVRVFEVPEALASR